MTEKTGRVKPLTNQPMKAQELRIGNWVKDHGETGQQWPVSSINQNGFTAGPMEVFPAGMMHDWGIPLTAEWLERFGFVYYVDHWETDKGWIYQIRDGFEFELITGSERFNLYLIFRYVHQLQNLYFALTGTELELTKA